MIPHSISGLSISSTGGSGTSQYLLGSVIGTGAAEVLAGAAVAPAKRLRVVGLQHQVLTFIPSH